MMKDGVGRRTQKVWTKKKRLKVTRWGGGVKLAGRWEIKGEDNP